MKSGNDYKLKQPLLVKDIFQDYPYIQNDNSNQNFTAYEVANNSLTDDFIQNILGIYPTSFDMYFISKFGERRLSSLVEMYFMQHIKYDKPLQEYKNLNPFGGDNSSFYSLNYTFMNDLKRNCANKYGNSWKKLYEVYIKEYDILSPYSVTVNENSTDNLGSNNAYTGSDSDNLESKLDSDNQGNSEDGVYGFNSRVSVPNNTSNDKSTRKQVGKDTRTLNSTGNTTYSRDITFERLLTRKGNIGNTSAPELIEREISLRKQLLFDIIVFDLSELLTRQKYI